MREPRIGITGTPATGKKAVGMALADEFHVPFLSLNEVAEKAGLLVKAKGGEPKLDARGFNHAAASLLPEGGYVIAGVFLPEAVPSRFLDSVVVLRCNPLILARRYDERGYDSLKRKENLTAEFLDACLGAALKAYGDKVREVDVSGMGLSQALSEVSAALRERQQKVGVVDWLSLVRGPDDVSRFMV